MSARGLSRWKPKQVAIGNLRSFGQEGKQRNKINIRVNRTTKSKQRALPSNSHQSSFGTLTDWSTEEIAAALENVPVDVNDFIANPSYGASKKLSRRKRKRRKNKISYREKRRRVLQSWKDQRHQIREVFIAGEVMPEDTSCNVAECAETATCRCIECGIQTYFCTTHVHEAHQEQLHVPEIWQVSLHLQCTSLGIKILHYVN